MKEGKNKITAEDHYNKLTDREKKFIDKQLCPWCAEGKIRKKSDCPDTISPCSDEKIISRRKILLKFLSFPMKGYYIPRNQ